MMAQTRPRRDLIIRTANVETDALAIMDGARDFAQRVAVRSLLPDDDEAFTAAVGRIVTLPNVEILVAEHEGHVVSGIGVGYSPYLWNPDLLVAEELFWWAVEGAPFRAAWKLLNEAMRHIDDKGAIPMFRALSTSPRGVERLYRKMGLELVETLFVRLP